MFHYVKVGQEKYALGENCGSDQVYSQIDKTRIYYFYFYTYNSIPTQ